MVRQNLVAYILGQHKQGKTLQEITEFLINAGYDKQEVESSIQYIINLERSPEIAEQQRIQQLSDYIRTQVGKGYDQHVIVNFLISKGCKIYPFCLAFVSSFFSSPFYHRTFIWIKWFWRS